MTRPRKMTAVTRDALHRDLGAIPAVVNELAGKHGIAPTTVAKHIALLAVHAPGAADWNVRLANHRRGA